MDKDKSDEASRSFMQNLLELDSKVLEKLKAAHREPEEMYKIIKERLDIYMLKQINILYLIYIDSMLAI